MDLAKQIVEIIASKPGIAVSQICRTLNERGVSYCSKKICYANQRKIDYYGKRPHSCKHDRRKVFKIIDKMEEDSKIKTRREQKTDTRQNRNWDWMRGCYLPSDYPDFPDQTSILEVAQIATNADKEGSS